MMGCVSVGGNQGHPGLMAPVLPALGPALGLITHACSVTPLRRIRYAAARACSRSAMMSSMSSMPMHSLIISGVTAADSSSSADNWRCVVEAGCAASDFNVTDIDQAQEHLKGIVEPDTRVITTLDTEGEQGGRPAIGVFFCQWIIG